jgi:probable phosphoglycerate mutase
MCQQTFENAARSPPCKARPVSSQAIPQPTSLAPAEFNTELLLIRHGRSMDVVPGSDESLDPPLSEVGVAQAAALAARLQPKRIDAVYASDLARAVSTASPLAAARGLELHQRKELREVWLGDWEKGEFRRRAHVRDPEWMAFAESGRWDLVPNSEGDDAFRARVSAAVGAILTAHVGQTVAVVCHGGVINAYLAALYDLRPSWWVVIENTSITSLRATGSRQLVMGVNDCHHLYDPVVAAPG